MYLCLGTEVSEEFEKNKKWLKVSTGPWTKVLDLWLLTSRERLQAFRSESGNIADGMREWPLYKDPNGYTLVRDFPLNNGKLDIMVTQFLTPTG